MLMLRIVLFAFLFINRVNCRIILLILPTLLSMYITLTCFLASLRFQMLDLIRCAMPHWHPLSILACWHHSRPNKAFKTVAQQTSSKRSTFGTNERMWLTSENILSKHAILLDRTMVVYLIERTSRTGD